MATIETDRGPIDEGLLVKTSGVEDSARYYGPWEEYHLKSTGELVARLEGRDPLLHGAWLKVNAFEKDEEPDAMINVEDSTGVRSALPRHQLHRKIGMLDNPNETTSWVEYRMPNTDQVIHRSVDVKLKRPYVTATGTAAQL